MNGKRTLTSQFYVLERWYVDSRPKLLDKYGRNSLDLAEDTLAFRDLLLGGDGNLKRAYSGSKEVQGLCC